MGTTTKSSTKPIYGSQVTGAANSVTDAYKANQPAIQNTANSLQALTQQLIGQYNTPTPTTAAANDYVTGILGGKGGISYTGDPALAAIVNSKSGYSTPDYYKTLLNTSNTFKPNSYFENIINSDPASNPALQGMIDQTNRDTYNTFAAQGGTRGLTGGTAIGDVIAKNIANADTTLRYNDFTTQQGRQDTAAQTEAARQDAADQLLSGQKLSASTSDATLGQQARDAAANRAATAAAQDAQMKLQAQTAAAQQQQAAAALAAQLQGLQQSAVSGILNTATTASGLPISAATQSANSVGSILGPYTNSTQKTSGLGTLLAPIGAGLSGWASSGFA